MWGFGFAVGLLFDGFVGLGILVLVLFTWLPSGRVDFFWDFCSFPGCLI